MTDTNHLDKNSSAGGFGSLTASGRFQIYFLLIAISAASIFGRMMAADNIPDRAVTEFRFRQIPKQLEDRKKELVKKGLTVEQQERELARIANALVQDAKKDRPTLSANDRSRFLTLRVLVEPQSRVYRYLPCDEQGNRKSYYEKGEVKRNCACQCPDQFNPENATAGRYIKQLVPYAIDKAMEMPGWDTIDMVKHGLPDEYYDPADAATGYLYSSKPPLLPTLMAIPYAGLYHAFGFSLTQQPFETVRILLVVINLIPLVLAWFLMAIMIDRLGRTDWGRIFAMAALCFGTFLSTFAVTLNNHLPGVVCIVLALFGLFRILNGGKLPWYILTGFFAPLSAVCDLPAAAIALIFFAILFYRSPGKTVFVAVPVALLVIIPFFWTNQIAHQSVKPAYAKKRDHSQMATSASGQIEFSADDWYIYNFIPSGQSRNQANARNSYWMNRVGIDKGEPSRLLYLFHATIGHHGIFSLTPVWILSLFGGLFWLRRGSITGGRIIAATAVLATLAFFAFYLSRDQGDRNYGGMTACLRWFFPLVPLWVLCMLPTLDKMASYRIWRIIALVLLFASILSVAYPLWNPWSHPWLYNGMIRMQWINPY